MSVQPVSPPAAGWYSDPWNAAVVRWFDGAQWTPQVSSAPGWYPDPQGLAPLRWFDGTMWTADIHDPATAPSANQTASVDESVAPEDSWRAAVESWLAESGSGTRTRVVTAEKHRRLTPPVHGEGCEHLVRPRTVEVDVWPGTRVFFVDEDGLDSFGVIVPRENLVAAAEARDLDVVDVVTAKGCDLVVAAEVSSGSIGADLARRFGIPVVTVADFLTGVDDRVPVEGLAFD